MAQRKRELGGNKMVSRITLFCSDHEVNFACLLFEVEDEGVVERDAGGRMHVDSLVVRRARDGRDVVRERVFRARL